MRPLDMRKPLRRGADNSGADNGARTRDPHLGKVMLYQLSHVRIIGGENRIRTGGEGFAGPCLTTWPSRRFNASRCAGRYITKDELDMQERISKNVDDRTHFAFAPVSMSRDAASSETNTIFGISPKPSSHPRTAPLPLRSLRRRCALRRPPRMSQAHRSARFQDARHGPSPNETLPRAGAWPQAGASRDRCF